MMSQGVCPQSKKKYFLLNFRSKKEIKLVHITSFKNIYEQQNVLNIFISK